jgi:uncharacterized membrane protein
MRSCEEYRDDTGRADAGGFSVMASSPLAARELTTRSTVIERATRTAIAIGFAAFGAHQIFYASFVTRAIGVPPQWVPWQPFLAVFTGIALIAAAVAMGLGRRDVAVALGAACLVFALLIHLPNALANPADANGWILFGKGLVIAGCAFTVAGSLGARFRAVSPQIFIAYGKCSLGAFMILSGVLHFMFRSFVVFLFPPWIPWHMFFTLLAGVLLICGGIGMMVPMTTRLASLLSGIMILAWVPLIHIPLALKNLRNPKESVPVFEALAFGSLAILAWVVETREHGRSE